MKSNQLAAIRVHLTDDLNEEPHSTHVVIDKNRVFIIQTVPNDNAPTGESVERIDITTVQQIDQLITILTMARNNYL